MSSLGEIADPSLASGHASGARSEAPEPEPAPARSNRRATWVGLAATLVACSCISVVLYWPTWSLAAAGKPALAGAGKDPGLYAWFLVWTPYALTHHLNPLFSNYMVYPHQLNMMWNTSMELVAALMWPFTAAVGPLTSFNLAMTLAPILTGSVTFLALRRHVSAFSAVLGAVFYAFCPELVARESTHLVLAIAFYPPLLWILLEVIGTSPRFRTRLLAGVALGVATVAELMIEPEFLVVAAIGAGLGIAYLAILNPRVVLHRLSQTLAALAVAVGTFLPLAAVPLNVMLFGPGRLHGPAQPANLYVQDLAAVLMPTKFQAVTVPMVHTHVHVTGDLVESAGYFGPVLISALLIITIARWRSLRVRWAVLMTLTLLVLSLGPEVHWEGRLTGISLPWAIIRHAPLLDNLVSNRLLLVCYLPVALLLGVGIDSLRTARYQWLRFLGAVGLLAVAVSLAPSRFDAQVIYTPRFFTSAALNRIPEGSPTLIYPLTDAQFATVWQAEAGMRFRVLTGRVVIPNAKGVSALDVCESSLKQCFGLHLLPPTSNLAVVVEAAKSNHLTPRGWRRERKALSAAMRLEHIGTVIARPARTQYEYVKLFTRFFQRPPEWFGHVAVWPHATYPPDNT